MKEIKCEYCNNKWITKSKNILVTCSSCGRKTKAERINHVLS